METYTTAIWIVHRVRENMVNIHQHGGDHYKICKKPITPKEYNGQDKWNQKM